MPVKQYSDIVIGTVVKAVMLLLVRCQLGTSRSHFFAPESECESFDFEYLLISSPDPILWQRSNAVPSNLHILLQALDFRLQINEDGRLPVSHALPYEIPEVLSIQGRTL